MPGRFGRRRLQEEHWVAAISLVRLLSLLRKLEISEPKTEYDSGGFARRYYKEPIHVKS